MVGDPAPGRVAQAPLAHLCVQRREHLVPAHAAVEGEHPIKYMLEEQIVTEQEDVWEIEKFLSMHQIQVKSKTIDLAAS